MDVRRLTSPLSYLSVLFLQVISCMGSQTSPLAPAMFILGDSLIDNGNNNYLPSIAKANYFPYGIDMGLPTGRFCNGLTVVDYGALFLGLPLIPPYLSLRSKGLKMLRGVNYASAAAGILDETGKHYGARTPLNGQILLFEKTVRLELPPFFQTLEALSQFLAKSIFLINIGGNDYINNYLLPDMYTSSKNYNGEAFADLLIRNLSQQLKNLYSLGARKMVLVGLGALGCIPSQLSKANNTDGCVEPVNNLVTLYNTRLVQLLNTLNASLPGSFFVYHNAYDIFRDMINKPSSYGFTIPNQACCGNGKYGGALSCLPLQKFCSNRDQYVFWDSFHPTQAVNKIIATGCYTESSTDCYPISVYQLAQI